MKGIPSPEEEEETLESEADRAGKAALPSSAFRDLLQASPSRQSAGRRTATLTPTPSDSLPLRKGSLLAPRPPGRPRKLNEADESPQPTAGSSKHTQAAGPSKQTVAPPRSSRSHAVIYIDEDSDGDEDEDGDDETEIVAQRRVEEDPRKPKPTHGPSAPQETINIESEDDQLDIQSFPISNSNPPPRRRKRPTRKCKGAPYIELPLLPLQTLKRFCLPFGYRGPTPLSRHQQIEYNQTPPRSHASSEGESATFRLLQQVGNQRKRSGRFPTWATMPNDEDESSSDLGGYGEVPNDDEIESSNGEGSDGIEIHRRTTRNNGKGKGKEKEMRRTTRAEAIKPKTYHGQLAHIAFSSSRSASGSRTSRDMPPRREKRKRIDDFSSPSFKSNSTYELVSPDSDEDEIEVDEDSESDYSGYNGRSRRKGRPKKGNQRQDKVSEDVLYQHRSFCEKCQRGPADDLLEKAREKKRKSKGKKRKKHEDDMSDEEIALQLEGWLTCERCVVASHWFCLGGNQKKIVLDELQAREGPVEHGRKKIRNVGIDEEASFLCSRCSADSKCFVCHSGKLVKGEAEAHGHLNGDRSEAGSAEKKVTTNGDAGPNATGNQADRVGLEEQAEEITGEQDEKDDEEVDEEKGPLRFRCFRCKQEAHYEHLCNPFTVPASTPAIANHYQLPTDRKRDQWECHQCRAWVWTVETVIAWRPLPAGAVENLAPGEIPNYKDPLPREYLVKWADRGFRHVTWVPHAWLLVNSAARLKNFLVKGPMLDLITDETLAAKGDEMEAPTIANVLDEADRSNAHHPTGDKAQDDWVAGGPAPDVDGASSLPPAWSTVDRILDAMLLPPPPKAKKKPRKNVSRNRRDTSESITLDYGDATDTMVDGIEPYANKQMNIDDWETETGRKLIEDDVDEVAKLVTWYYVKWDDLQYDQSTWDTPPPVSNTTLYEAYKAALKRYLRDRKVIIPILNQKQCERRELRAEKFTRPPSTQPACIVGGTLMPFQMNGFQWLLTKYFSRDSCILADDMGLGKTIQIASLIGYLGSQEHKIYPFLVVVPNSTITNWVREFEKWVPHLRVVPYYGMAASRKVISKYELYRKGLQGKAEGLKAHVVLTTYDVITGGDFSIFKDIPRWEMLIVDEGQRLKSDSNLIFNRLKTLNAVHRILLTGTPLNNNLRELFNLLNFLDPVNFQNLTHLEERFSDLNETLLGELHDMIQPYILRRIKADVLRLPPKIEIIVPISLTPIQKHVYRGILEKHADLIKAVMAQRKKKVKPVPAITGGEVIPNHNTENGPMNPVIATTEGEGEAAVIPQATVDGTVSAAPEMEMDETANVETTGPVLAGTPEKDKDATTGNTTQPIMNGTHDIIDQQMVVDTDNTDSALVEDTI